MKVNNLPEREHSVFVVSLSKLSQNSFLLSEVPYIASRLEEMREVLVRFPLMLPDSTKDSIIDGIIATLCRMEKSKRELGSDYLLIASSKDRRLALERLIVLLTESVRTIRSLPSYDLLRLFEELSVENEKQDKTHDGNLIDDFNLLAYLNKSKDLSLDSKLSFMHRSLQACLSAVQTVALELNVQRGRPRIPHNVENAIEFLGCIWAVSTSKLPNNSNKKGSFGDFVRTFAPMLIDGATPSQITTATRQLVSIMQHKPNFLQANYS